MEKHLNKYLETRKKIKAYGYFMWLFSWDNETEAPPKSFDYAMKQYAYMAEEMYKITSDKEYLDSIDYLYEHRDELEMDLKAEIRNAHKQMDIIKKVPKDEYLEYQILANEASVIWRNAKENDDFLSFLPYLEKIVAFNKKLVKYLETDELKGYDILLDMYEEGMTSKIYDDFFDKLKTDLVPFVQKITSIKKKYNKKLYKQIFPINGQREFSQYIMKELGFDFERGLLKTSAHPFTSGVASSDVRITTKFHEDQLFSAIYSTIHETGHAIYEQNMDPKYDETNASSGVSMGIHESQSRMYENMIGRSFAFWETHYPKLQSIFPKQLKNVSLFDIYRYVNKAEKTLIRIEADELTYSLHIMVRYELEKELINGKLKPKDLPKKWRLLYQEYLGKKPKTDKEGVLQDVHWSGGSFGYFPTYALGSAYAAQIYAKMNEEINVEVAIQNKNMQLVNDWLKEHIHQFSGTKTPKELIYNATKEEFNPQYYIDYLIRKFTQLNEE